jgi:hypothetical protein
VRTASVGCAEAVELLIVLLARPPSTGAAVHPSWERTRLGGELVDRHADVVENAAQGSTGDVAVAVHWHGGSTSVRVSHDVVAAGHSCDLEAVPFQCADDAGAGDPDGSGGIRLRR